MQVAVWVILFALGGYHCVSWLVSLCFFVLLLLMSRSFTKHTRDGKKKQCFEAPDAFFPEFLYLLKWPSDDNVSSLSVLLSQSPVFILSSSALCLSSRDLARSRGKPRNKTRAATGAKKTQRCSYACQCLQDPVPFS